MKLRFVLLLTLNGTLAFAQNSVQRLDSMFNSLYEYKQINGNVLVGENGNETYKHSFGYANIPNKMLNSDEKVFSLASVSKIFTSTAILMLREKGKLKLDDLVIQYFADFPYNEITIRNLLSHTSGLPELEIFRQQIKVNPNKVFTNSDFLPTIKDLNLPLEFKPNDKYEYRNTNYILLALIIEKISGLSFQYYLRENIFSPLKMSSTFFEKDDAHSLQKNRVTNYEYEYFYSTNLENVDSLKKHRIRLFNLSGFVGNGNIMSTITDLLKFDQALYSRKILNEASLIEAFTPTKLNNSQSIVTAFAGQKASYGLGWFILADTLSGKTVGHTGGLPGATSILIRNIDKKQTIIILDNLKNASIFKSAVNALNVLNNNPIMTPKQSLVQLYGSILKEKGIDAGFCMLQKLKDDEVHYYLDEDDMNELGLQLLYAEQFVGHTDLALEVLKLNTLLFPNSFNTYDSYGEALAKLGKKDEAIYMYKKSIALNPDNAGGKKVLEELLNSR